MHELFEIPIEQINDSEQIVIYGAGRLGRSLLRQTKKKGKHVVAFIDRNYHKRIQAIDEVPILGLDSIEQFIDSYFCVAISDILEAKKVKEYLKSCGVDDNRIVLGEGHGFLQDSTPEELIKFCRRSIVADAPMTYLFSLAEHGNTGDYLIGYAAEKFLTKYFPDNKFVGITTIEWFQLKELLARMIRPVDIVFINGGGFFGTLRGDDVEYKDIVESFPKNIKIFLPNTLTYGNSDPELCDDFHTDMEWLNKQTHLHLFFRDRRSYETVCKYYGNVYLSPDMALFWDPVTESKAKKNTNKILICLRNDCEMVDDIREKVENSLRLNDFEFDNFDICTNEYYDQYDGRKLVEYVMDLFSNYKCIITDRLHAMLISTIVSVPCVAFDNLTKKISGVYEWISDCEYISIINADEVVNIKKHIEKVCDVNTKERFEPLEEEFNSMASIIKQIIGNLGDEKENTAFG